jgi:capsular exopolysaccharide synthesis family protein
VDIRDYLRILRRGWPVLLAIVLAGVAAGVLVAATTTKIYEASVELFVATSANQQSPTDLANGNVFTQDRVQSYTDIAASPAVTNAVVKDLDLSMSSDQLASKISADAPLNKVLINLHVTDQNPTTATRLANAVAVHFAQVVEQTEQTDADGNPVVKLTVIRPAKVPSTPIKPNKVLDIGLGFLIGLFLGVGVILLRERLDNTIKGPSDFEKRGVPVLGVVPFDKRTQQTPIAFRADPHGLRSEAYRQLRTNLQFVNVDHSPRIIAITSAVPGEGKSITAINLAAALAEAGHRVCLIEADFRRPTIANTLGLVKDVGFTTALIGRVPIQSALQNVGHNLAVLTSGPVPPNPSELLISEQARTVIREIADHVDYTIIDTAPLLPVADGAEVAAMADATLVVYRSGKTSQEQVTRSFAALQKVGERPVGVILNMVTRSGGRYDYEYSYYYSYRPDRSRREAAHSANGVETPKLVPVAADDSDRHADDIGENQPAAVRAAGPGPVHWE